MALPKHLDEAARRLEQAWSRIERARASPSSPELTREWLEALTDHSEALADLHRFTNESIHEKLHELARHLRLEDFPWGAAPHPAPGG